VPSDSETRLPQRKRRVLVVEDDQVIASSLTADLKEFGFVVIGPAHSLADASALASTVALDCPSSTLRSVSRRRFLWHKSLLTDTSLSCL
jgi:hypothetical protein